MKKTPMQKCLDFFLAYAGPIRVVDLGDSKLYLGLTEAQQRAILLRLESSNFEEAEEWLLGTRFSNPG